MLAAYTGFLLSTLNTFPLLNNPVLPILFLVLEFIFGCGGVYFIWCVGLQESPHSPGGKYFMDPRIWTRPVVMFELFVLITFFTGLIFAGQSEQAVWNAISVVFWASWFWYGVIGVGMVLPLFAECGDTSLNPP